jgi:hydroxyacylglutathione hydrolase
MELKHGIHKFEGMTGVNCYWTTSNEGVAVIDTANPKSEVKILDQLKAAGKNAGDVKWIIITHADIDHLGSAAELKHLTGAKIAIHVSDAAILKGQEPMKEARGFFKFIFKIMTGFFKFHTTEPDILLKDGDEVAGFKVLHTPGHTKGSIMLFKPNQVLITGDTLLCDRHAQPRGPIKLFTPNMDQAWNSIRKLHDLNFEMMLPGHGKPILENAGEKVRALMEKKHLR